jgi:hypothetical protein
MYPGSNLSATELPLRIDSPPRRFFRNIEHGQKASLDEVMDAALAALALGLILMR